MMSTPSLLLKLPAGFSPSLRRAQISLLLVCALSLPLVLAAQAPAPGASPEPPPDPPLLAGAPAGIEWTIAYAYTLKPTPSPAATSGAPDSAPPPVIKSVKVTKSGTLRREVASWSDNAQSENWQVDNVLIRREPTWPPGFLVAQRVGGAGNDDFRLPWIGVDYFKGTVSLNGRQCHLYEAPDSVASPGEKLSAEIKAQANDPKLPENIRESIRSQMAREQAAATTKTRAWVDAKTRLPIAVQGSGVTWQFTFAPGAATLTLPSAYEKEYEALKRLYPR